MGQGGGKTGEFRRRFDTEKEEERGKSKRRDGGRESERVEVGDGKGGRRGGGNRVPESCTNLGEAARRPQNSSLLRRPVQPSSQ